MKGPPQLEDLISGFEHLLNNLLSAYHLCIIDGDGHDGHMEIFDHLRRDAGEWLQRFSKFQHINTALEFFLSRPDIKLMKIRDEYHVTLLASDTDMYGDAVAYGYTPIAAIMMFHHIHGPRDPGDYDLIIFSFNGKVVPIKEYKEKVLKRQELGTKTREHMYKQERMKNIGDMASRIKIKRLIKV